MADDFTRIINLTEATEISDGMYLVTDASTGTRKLSLQKVLDKSEGIVANKYDSTATYDVGDFCIYNNTLYECTTAITTAEVWTAEHWTSVVLGDDVSDIKKDVRQLSTSVGQPVNKSYSGQVNASSSLIIISDEPIPLTGGHTYTLTLNIATASDNPVYFYLRDSDNTTYLRSQTLNAGDTTKSLTYTPESDTSVLIGINNGNRNIIYSFTFVDNNQSTRISTLETDVAGIEADVTNIHSFIGDGNAISFNANTYIATPDVGGEVTLTPSALSGCASCAIQCSAGDMFTLLGTPRDNSGTRAYMWVNSSGKCVFRYNETAVMDHVVITAPCDGTLVVNYLTSSPYSVNKGVYDLNKYVVSNCASIKELENLKTSPIETLPFYIKNELAYRPLGQLQHGYLCLTCDDGTEGLGTYTIPMLEEKDVPCTFGLWSTSYQNDLEQRRFSPSEILQTAEGIQLVKDAVENIGCAVAQHGAEYWTELTEKQLNAFFDAEAERFAELEIPVTGAVCPGHCVNNRTRAITGGRFESIRAGYNGHLSEQDMINGISGDVFTPYGLLTGARSNCYSYTSFNIVDADKTIDALKTLLDNAIANNLCMICHWHDWNFIDTDADYLANRTKLEAFIDYAKTSGVTFCTLGEIPRLV